jgi:competence protein ComEC
LGGAFPIINAMPVGMIFDSGQKYAGRAYNDAMAAAKSHAVQVIRVRRGIHWASGDGVTLDVLAPLLPTLIDTGDDINENSIVTRLTYFDGSRTFRELFMGDAGEASEARLLASGADLRADVLEVGHHGSRYASTAAFIAAVHPNIAVISVGRHNTFGRPALATIDTLVTNEASVFRTDRCGAITIKDALEASTLLPCTAK